MRKIPFAGIELTSQRIRGLRGTSELPGRPAPVRAWNVDIFYNTGDLSPLDNDENRLLRVIFFPETPAGQPESTELSELCRYLFASS